MMMKRASVVILLLMVSSASASLVDTCSPDSFYAKHMYKRFIFSSAYDAVYDAVHKCWKTWSRCTRWSKAGTGTVWETCDECCKIKGRNGGSCQRKPSNCLLTDFAWQCDCY